MYIFLLLWFISWQTPDYYTLSQKDFSNLPEVNQPINLFSPNYNLLDAALFHATNEAREQEKLSPFIMSKALHQAAAMHSTDMIQQDFYDHINPKTPEKRTPDKRIKQFSEAFMGMGENIAQYDALKNPTNLYCMRLKPNGQWDFFDCKTQQSYQPYTYWEYARHIVRAWMNSPHHRENILNRRFNYLGCAGRLSKNPFQTKSAPFMRLTQNFGN
jgi:uncharacterized protein YkwD